MDSLDASPITFCRNEPNECVPSQFDRLVNQWRIGADGAALSQWWDQVIEHTATHMGERDHRLNNPKTFVHPISQALGIAQLSARPRFRKFASRAIWAWDDGEWKMPRWVGNLNDPEIFTIVKLVQSYNWATWVLENRPEVPVVQIVRHPGARHESFLRRYVAHAGAETTRIAKIEQLRELTTEPGMKDRMGSVDDLTLAEAETWFGIYQMETFELRAAESPRYLRVVYEEMVGDPGGTIERIYDHLGLPLPNEVRSTIEAQRSTSVFGPVSKDQHERVDLWRERLDQSDVEAIDNILCTSSIASWWSSDASEEQQVA